MHLWRCPEPVSQDHTFCSCPMAQEAHFHGFLKCHGQFEPHLMCRALR